MLQIVLQENRPLTGFQGVAHHRVIGFQGTYMFELLLFINLLLRDGVMAH